MVVRIVEEWFDAGQPVDDTGVPHEVKAFYIRSLAERYGLDTLVETGTGHGAMVEMVLNDFVQIYSVEMQPTFQAHCRAKFADNDHVHLFLGDSTDFVTDMVRRLDGQAAIWFLDAHYAGEGTARGELDTPVVAELTAILSDDTKHVVIVDDARLFGKDKDYPTIDEVFEIAGHYDYKAEICGDEIVIT